GAVPWFYLYKALVPINLSFVYPQWEIRVNEVRWWLLLVASLAATGLLLANRHSRWGRPLLFAWLFYCVALLPVSGLVDVYFMNYSLVADHYQHIAMIGLVALVAACMSLVQRKVTDTFFPPVAIAAAAITASLLVLAYRQAGLYCDEITLYSDTLEKNTDAWLAHVNLGMALEKCGRISDAIQHYREAVRLAPDFAPAWYDLGGGLVGLHKTAQAVETLGRAG